MGQLEMRNFMEQKLPEFDWLQGKREVWVFGLYGWVDDGAGTSKQE